MTEAVTNNYVWHMNLTIKNLQKADFGTYICSSVNALGKSDGRVRLQGTYNFSFEIYKFNFYVFFLNKQNFDYHQNQQQHQHLIL